MDITPIIVAFTQHQWALFGALLVGLFVAVQKQGWLGTWLQNAIPVQYLPYYAVALSLATLMSGEIIAGKSWQNALIDAVNAALLAVAGHQFVIEGLRGGKEIIPAKILSSATGTEGSFKKAA